MRLFLDASAMAKRYRREAGTKAVAARLRSASALGLCPLTVTEVVSAMCRWKRERLISPEQYTERKQTFLADWAGAEVVALGPVVYARAVQLLEHHALRSAGALQVASALEWHCDLFLSGDQRQCAAARAAGLEVEELPLG